MSKNWTLLSAVILPFLVLNGCAIGEPTEDKNVPIEKVDMSRYEARVGEGVFKQTLNVKFADVIVDGEIQMFTLQEAAIKQLEAVREGSEIQFIYALNEESREYEIHSISAVNGQVLTPIETTTEVKEEVQKKEEDKVLTIDMEVDYGASTQIVKAIPSDFIKGTFNVIDTYQWKDSTLRRENVEVRFATVEDTIENDVQKERWRAAGNLKKVGEFKEIEGKTRDLEDVKFVFNVETDNVYQEVMMIKNKFGYLRIEIDTIPSLRTDVIAEVVAMLNSVN